MNTVTAILETASDGTLHLPVPEELRHGKIEVTATLRPVQESLSTPASTLKAGCLQGFWTSSDFNAPLDDFKEYSF